jgi:ribonuclease HI
MDPESENEEYLIDESRNHIKLIWVSSHVGIDGNEPADQAAKEALNEGIDNQETQDLMKWIKKEELMNRQRR